VDSPGWPDLLPAHRADGDDQPVGRPRCLDAIPLGDSLRLAVYEDDRGRTYPVPVVDTSVEVRRARPGDGASEALLALLSDGDRRIGSVEVTTWHHSSAAGERAITVDQTNESVVVGERAVVKWTFLAEEGPHPGPSLLAELSRNGFTGMPRPWGAVQWHPADGTPARLLALVVDFLPGAVDGWTWVVDRVREAAGGDRGTAAQDCGAAIGALVAEFHRALAGTSRRAAVDEAARLKESALADLERALSVTAGTSRDVLVRRARELRAVFDAMPGEATPLMRVHGDLHIGQVLSTGTVCALTDFDGNPVVPASQRWREQPAAVDVAGMAQSFTHAGLVVRKHHPGLSPDRVTRMAGAARMAFLATYREGLGDRASLLDERLLRPLALQQVCREFTYAATHLPRWSYVPEAALPMLLEGP
jgi:maltokinase